MGDIEEYPFSFLNTPASLQTLASTEMALILWRREFAYTSHFYENTNLFVYKRKFRCKNVLAVRVPPRIEAQIDNKIDNVGEDLRSWVCFHSKRNLFDVDSHQEFAKCFKHIVADFSGCIGFKATATNMLNSGEFSPVENYKIACSLCLEDEVKRFWPSVENDARIEWNDQDYDECNLLYWNGYMKSGGNSITDIESAKRLAKRTVICGDGGDGTAFEYFCKMLPDRERVSLIESLLGWHEPHDSDLKALIRHLRMLNRVHAEQALEYHCGSIFRTFLKSHNYHRYLYQLWTLMRHSILKNEWTFSQIIHEFLRVVQYPEEGMNYARFDQINDLMLEIWSCASEELKARFSNHFLQDNWLGFHFSNVVASADGFSAHYGHDMTFYLEVTSKLRNVNKLPLWRANWRGLALRSKPSYLEQFMRICSPNDDGAIESFKNQIADFEDLFRSLIRGGFYSDLKDYLMLCSKDTKQFQQLGKKALGSNLYFILLHDDDTFVKFDWLVDEVFSNVKKDADEFKIQMILSAQCLKCLLAVLKAANEISTNDFSRIISRFVANERDELQLVKRKLFEHCRSYPIDFECTRKDTFNADQWQEFLEWCTVDREELSAFKSSLNLDEIFFTRLNQYLDGTGIAVLAFLDTFLKWYFNNIKVYVKNFKLNKMKNFKRIDNFDAMLESRDPRDRDLMYELFRWLFR